MIDVLRGMVVVKCGGSDGWSIGSVNEHDTDSDHYKVGQTSDSRGRNRIKTSQNRVVEDVAKNVGRGQNENVSAVTYSEMRVLLSTCVGYAEFWW